ncbi:glycosyl transferase family 2 [Sphingobacterium deserti]|uniref:Glycosyl transferase family 2 n=2 Tax=Sphingobacterium deserti TaxID=1229276 RepID=A0A0B8T6T9_9SPHI|nr:glycosyl transferase family 2 [Sphingobacterium deserti]
MELESLLAQEKYIPENKYSTFAFPLKQKPEVTIIIPFYNNQHYTQQCLLSIYENLPRKTFEIILVDDNSSESIDLDHIQNIKYVKNETNLGFLKSVNEGIKLASGNYIYLLNNDTVVQPGFLDELVSVFETYEDVGAVGSMLLNADGTLQEAGTVFLKDNVIVQIAQIPVYYPEVNYVYEVDYCSGCSLLFRKLDNNGQLNLLDDLYSPAYFEETDLCFRLRYEQGKKIYYTPFSKIIHFNGVSYNVQNEGRKREKARLLEKNRNLFNERWKNELNAIQATSVSKRIIEFCNNKQIVFFNDQMPQYDNNSGELRLTEIMMAYKILNYHVTLVATGSTYNNRYNAYYQKMGIVVLYEHLKSDDISHYFKRMQIIRPIVWMYAVVTFMKYYKLAKKIWKKFFLIFDMVDIHHLRFERALMFTPEDKFLKKEYDKFLTLEKKASNLADLVIPISEQEEIYMRRFCSKEKMIVVSNVHYPKVDPLRIPDFQDRSGLLFVGSRHAPNIDAVYYMLEEIMPKIWETLPVMELHIVGDVDQYIPPEMRNYSNIFFHGFVPDIAPFFLTQRVMVAPLRYGAGVKGKIGQAFEYYLPVVSTGVGTEGMQLETDKNVLIAENAESFAAATLRLYQDPALWNKLKENSLSSLSPFSKEQLNEKIKLIESKLFL